MTVFWVVAPCSLVEIYRRFRGACVLMIEATSISETSINFYQTTRRNNPEDSHLYIHSEYIQRRTRLSLIERSIMNSIRNRHINTYKWQVDKVQMRGTVSVITAVNRYEIPYRYRRTGRRRQVVRTRASFSRRPRFKPQQYPKIQVTTPFFQIHSNSLCIILSFISDTESVFNWNLGTSTQL
jgi:hypothetical protein